MDRDTERLSEGGLELIDTREDLRRAVEQLANGTGPVAVDAERASSYRYSERAYLVQLFRRGAGTFLIDPLAFEDLTAIHEVIADEEWVFHAAAMDLPCLRELGLEPVRVFDTELAARLLGLERVGLGAVADELLGVHLAKAHSADDWSKRPLPEAWLAYAALDVEVLVDLRDALETQLAEAGKTVWAQQEFAYVVAREVPPKREPWLKLAGTRVRNPRTVAIAHELWCARDELARAQDVSPGRLVPDRSLALIAQKPPRTKQLLAELKEFTGRESRSELDRWWTALQRGRTKDAAPFELAPPAPSAMPHHRGWKQRHPEAHERYQAIRHLVGELADERSLPIENLVTPDYLRHLAWQPPKPVTPATVAIELASLGARPWQIEETATMLAAVLVGFDQ